MAIYKMSYFRWRAHVLTTILWSLFVLTSLKTRTRLLVDLPLVALHRPNELSSTIVQFFMCCLLVVIVALTITCGERLQMVTNLMFKKMQSLTSSVSGWRGMGTVVITLEIAVTARHHASVLKVQGPEIESYGSRADTSSGRADQSRGQEDVLTVLK